MSRHLSRGIDRFVGALRLRNRDRFTKVRKALSHFPGPGLGMLCVLGFDGKFHLLDPAWEAALGFSNEELLRQPLMDLIHPEDYTTTCTCARNLWMGVEVRSFENRCRTKDGTYRWLLWNAAAVVSEKLICAAAVDITELKKREEALGPGAVQLPVAG